MARVDALITAGGRGTRIRELGVEKPMLLVQGVPLIEHVLRAARGSSCIKGIYVSVSANTPQTRKYLEERGIDVITTSGIGYCEDLTAAMGYLTTDQVLVCPADMPLLTSRDIDEVIARYYRSPIGSFSVAVPHELLRSLGISPTFRLEVEGRDTVLCGVSVVDRLQMLSVDHLDEGYMVTESLGLAMNVNTPADLRMAERMLGERSQRRDTSRA